MELGGGCLFLPRVGPQAIIFVGDRMGTGMENQRENLRFVFPAVVLWADV